MYAYSRKYMYDRCRYTIISRLRKICVRFSLRFCFRNALLVATLDEDSSVSCRGGQEEEEEEEEAAEASLIES